MTSPNQDRSVDTVTMQDVLDEEQELELETAAVLGGSDERNCTYNQGVVKRQALYSCLTCVPEAKEDCQKGTGVCLACSYACHENHELVELYTKRNFRCDCGTPKMRTKCSLEIKTTDNDQNEYNQNYSGLYCTCHRPYPDPESTNDDEMIQCVICEDWYHSLHLDTGVSSKSTDYFEMICGSCVTRADFLKDYTGLCVNFIKSEVDESKELNVTSVDESFGAESVEESNDVTSGEESVPAAKKPKLEESTEEEATSSTTKCMRPTNPGQYEKGALFWSTKWRAQLCRCERCLSLYEQLGVSFLIDAEDTVTFYEDKGLKKQAAKESDYDRGMRELSGLDRVRQIDAITAYNKMKTRLKDYLHQFVNSQQVVTEADIKRFFEQMRNDDQKDLMVHSNIPFNCR